MSNIEIPGAILENGEQVSVLARDDSFRNALRRALGFPLDLLVLLVASVPALLPLAAPGYLWGDDAEDPPWRSLELARSLSEGIVFPRWSADLFCGYGFPLFNFQSPLAFYPAAVLGLLTPIGYLDGSKITFGLSLLMAGAGASLLARHVLEHRGAALLAGVLYMYAPTTIGDVYARSTLSGFFALGILPFALWAFIALWERPSLSKAVGAALLVAALVLAHNITAAIAMGMMVAYATFHFCMRRDARGLAHSVLALVLGIGLSSFYLVPSIAEMGLTHALQVSVESFDFWGGFVDPLGSVQLSFDSRYYLQTLWGPFDLHAAYPYGPAPYKLGLLQGLLMLAAAAALLIRRKLPPAVVSLFLMGLLLFFGHLTWSAWVWQIVPAGSVIQFPWRLTRPAGLPLAVAAAWALLQLPRPWSRWAIPLVGVAAVVSGIAAAPTELKPFPYGPNITAQTVVRWQELNPSRAGTTSDGQFLPLSVDWEGFGIEKIMQRYGQSFPDERWVNQTAFLAEGSKAWVLATRRGQQWVQAMVEAAQPTNVALRSIYFAGWRAYLDGTEVPIQLSPWTEYEEQRRAALGVSQVEVPEGTHLVTLVFEDTPVRRGANIISALSALSLLVLLVAGLYRRGSNSKGRNVILVLAVALATLAAVAYWSHSMAAPFEGEAWVGNRVVRDLLAEAEQHQLWLSGPEGARVEDYVFLKNFTIQGDTRPVLYMHPTSSAALQVWLPHRASLQFAVGLDPQVWDKAGDGVEFQVEVRDGSETAILFDAFVDPKNRASDRRWVEGSVDLSRYASHEIQLTLRTLPGSSGDFDWAGWAEPRLVYTAP